MRRGTHGPPAVQRSGISQSPPTLALLQLRWVLAISVMRCLPSAVLTLDQPSCAQHLPVQQQNSAGLSYRGTAGLSLSGQKAQQMTE